MAQDKKAPRDADLGKKAATAVDKSLAGDITRKKDAKEQAAPALQYDQFRLGVELQVASKRREQIESLKKIIALSAGRRREAPEPALPPGRALLGRVEVLLLRGQPQGRRPHQRDEPQGRRRGQERAKAEKAELTAQSKEYGKLAVEQYTKIVQEYQTSSAPTRCSSSSART